MANDTPTPPEYSILSPRSFCYAKRARKSSGVVSMDGQRIDVPVVEITTVGPNERSTFSLYMTDARELLRRLSNIMKAEGE